MICIFCKSDATSSKSKEHIIPESLGNKEHILPPGIVCDKCNNYFSSKIEKKMLEQPYFMSLRFRHLIKTKKGKHTQDEGLLLPLFTTIGIGRDEYDELFIYSKDDANMSKLLNQKKGKLIIPIRDMPEKNDPIIARFLGKVGIEVLAKQLMNIKGGLEELINKKELDNLRAYVRYGISDSIWPYHIRRIYSEEELFPSETEEKYQVLHEYKLLYTDVFELYIVLIIMGIEYCLNMGAPYLDGYFKWLNQNNNRSPLEDEFCGGIDISTIK